MKKLLLITGLFLLAINIQAQVAVVGNKSVSESSINISQLNDIYSSKVKNWKDGSKIIRFTSKTDDAISDKLFGAIGKSSIDMKKLWMKLQLTGEGMAPEALGSDEEVINKVSSTPGAIGFIDAKKVNDKVKVLLKIN